MSSNESPTEEAAEISPDFDELANVLLPNATEALEEHGHFSPIAAFVQPDGTLCNIAVDFGDAGEPDPPEIVTALQDGLRDQVKEGQARSTAVCSIVVARLESGEPADAICVNLEQQAGDPLDIFLPFEKSDDGYTYGELVAGHGQSVVFADS